MRRAGQAAEAVEQGPTCSASAKSHGHHTAQTHLEAVADELMGTCWHPAPHPELCRPQAPVSWLQARSLEGPSLRVPAAGSKGSAAPGQGVQPWTPHGWSPPGQHRSTTETLT